jgi:hypothetical protein
VEIRCPYCQKSVQVPGGGQFTCPSCKAVFAVDLEPPAAPASPAGPPPLPGTADVAAPTVPVPPPSGPSCAKHPGVAATEACRRCGAFMCGACAQVMKDGRYCPDCAPFIGGGSGVPWERDRAMAGMASAFWQTMKKVLFEPTAFFTDMPLEGGLEGPLGFCVLGSSIFGLLGQMMMFAMLGALGFATGGARGGGAMMGQMGVNMVCSVFMIPIMSAIMAFVGAALFHVGAMILGGKGSFEATFRMNSYAMGSTAILQLIPIPYLNLIWHCAVMYVGFKVCHRMSGGSAAVAGFWPFVLFLCCIGVVIAAFGAAIWAAIQQGGHF